jgi:NADH-quinone oxidoreductase subunit L
VVHPIDRVMAAPLVVLAFLSITAGYVELPDYLGGRHPFSEFVSSVLPATPLRPEAQAVWLELGFALLAAAATLGGVAAAYALFWRRPAWYRDGVVTLGRGERLRRLLFGGWGFDALYERGVVQPFLRFARGRDALDAWVTVGLGGTGARLSRMLAATEDGRLRHYAAGVVLGLVAALAWLLR